MRRKLYYTLAVIGIMLLGSCKREREAAEAIPEKISIYDTGEVEIQPVVSVDSPEFRQFIDSLFTPERINELYGPGTHTFYMVVLVRDNVRQSSLKFRRNIFVSSGGKIDEGLTMLRGENDDLFNTIFRNIAPVLKLQPAMKLGQAVNAEKYYSFTVGYDADGRLIYPFHIWEINRKQYIPIFRGNHFLGEFRDSISGNMLRLMKAVDKDISYPEEARKLGVSGKVIIGVYVNEDGTIAGRRLVSGIGFGCDEIALHEVDSMTFYPTSDRKKGFLMVPFNFGLTGLENIIDLACGSALSAQRSGDSCRLSFYVRNVGNNTLHNIPYDISVYLDGKYHSTISSKTQLNPGESCLISFFWRSAKLGRHEYTLYIDPENKLREKVRYNNVSHGFLTVN